jgi:neutral ceramidase
MNLGVSQLDITPDHPLDLSGFAARTQPSTGVLDPIYLKCLYLEDGNEKLLWLHADLVAFAPDFVRAFRFWTRDVLGINAANVLLSATHTHSAPATISLTGCGQMNPHFIRDLFTNCQLVSKAAISRTQPCNLTIARTQLNLAVDRRKKPSAHVDPTLYLLAFTNHDNQTLAAVVNYAMHPVSLGHVNRQISADWCGAAASELTQLLSGRPITLITNGPAGNINPPGESVPPETVHAYGHAIARAAYKALLVTRSSSPCEPRLTILHQSLPIELDTLTEPEIDNLVNHHLSTIQENWIWAKPFRQALENWRTSRKRDLAAGLHSLDIELQLIKLGPLNIITVNGEMFSRFNQILRDKTRARDLFTVAYANEAFGYIPTNEAYDEGGYEVETAHFFYNSFRPKRGNLELLANRAAEMILQNDQ